MRTIGMMRNYTEPTKLALIMAKTLRYYNIDLIYLTPQGVNTITGKVMGSILRDEVWVTAVIDVPDIIDISPICFQREHIEAIHYLQGSVYLTDDINNRINKHNLHEYIKYDKQLSLYSIPSQLVGDLPSLLSFVGEHQTVVLKPELGGGNRHVYKIEKNIFGFYRVQFNKEALTLSEVKLGEYIEEHDLYSYIMQKYIQSKTLDNQPFNCRIHFEKNGYGHWEIASVHAKVDLEKNIVGTIKQQNGLINIRYILENLFGDKWINIYEKIIELSDILPHKMEQIRERPLMTLGADVGISIRGNLYIYEVLGAPSTEYVEYEVVNLRTQYYKHLLENIELLNN